MKGILEKTYNGFMEAIDSFANCTTVLSVSVKPVEETKHSVVSIPDFAYPCDNYINSVMDSRLVRQTLRAIASKYYGNQIEEVIQTASEVTRQNYPNLYANYQHCCQTLSVTIPPKVFVTPILSGINALSVEVDDTAVILLSYMSVIALDEAEQRFLLGHELGHILQGHIVAHTVQGLLRDLNTLAELLGPIVTDLIDVPLNRWYRTSEFTADRAGYLCCGDISVVSHLFQRFADGTSTDAYGQYRMLSDAYPSVAIRLEVLTEYSLQKQNLL
mgnify:CR=1 FL=1